MNPRVWFKSVSLENVRSFGEKQTINFTDKDDNAARWNVILGDNGTGKTTVLKGLCLAALHRFNADISATNFASLLRIGQGSSEAYTILEERTNESIFLISAPLEINSFPGNFIYLANMDEEWSEEATKPVMFAYGATRKIGHSAITQESNNYVLNLFDENSNLVNAEEWFVQTDYLAYKNKIFVGRVEKVKGLILTLFQGEISDLSFQIVDVNGSQVPKVFFKTHYGSIRLHELSLGYKTLIAWMTDFAKGLFERYPDSPDPLAEPAVCLVDEIDLHLHPKFQRTIIKFLTETFPNTQFIVTAHSPLIVQSAEDANIIVLKREGNQTVVESDRINVHDWRIDQILSSDMFGGIGGRAPDVEEKMKRRRTLLRKDRRTSEEDIELDELEKEMSELPVMETREALKAIDIISKAVISER